MCSAVVNLPWPPTAVVPWSFHPVCQQCADIMDAIGRVMQHCMPAVKLVLQATGLKVRWGISTGVEISVVILTVHMH